MDIGRICYSTYVSSVICIAEVASTSAASGRSLSFLEGWLNQRESVSFSEEPPGHR